MPLRKHNSIEFICIFYIRFFRSTPGKGKRGCKKEDLLSLPWDQIRCDDDDDDDKKGVYNNDDDDNGGGGV